MLFKMLGIEHAWQQYPHIGQKPRQVFITGSRVRALKAEEGFAKLMSSLEALGYSSEELRTMQKDVEQETDFTDPDDNQQWRSDLPERFSELLDDHFPLFITYDRVRTSPSLKHPTSPFCEQLCTMLQNDIMRDNPNDGSILRKTHVSGDKATSHTTPTSPRTSILRAGSGSMSSSDYTQHPCRDLVSYGVFLKSYWHHLPRTLTRALGEKQWRMHDLL